MEGTRAFGETLSSPDSWEPDFEASLDDIGSIIYTSGTTGQHKGATQTHRSILTSVLGCCVQNKFCADDRLLCALPLFNNFGLNVPLMSAVSGESHCSMELIREVEDRFSVVHFEGYGQTEPCGFTTLNPLVGVRRANFVGLPLSNIWIRIHDDKDRPLPSPRDRGGG